VRARRVRSVSASLRAPRRSRASSPGCRYTRVTLTLTLALALSPNPNPPKPNPNPPKPNPSPPKPKPNPNQVYSGDAHGNYAKKAVAGDVAVVAAAPARVERGGAATVVDGEGEVCLPP
jgi:hypothetical protein